MEAAQHRGRSSHGHRMEAAQLAPLQEHLATMTSLLAQAASDPPTLPYRSKYLALEEVARMQELLEGMGEGEVQAAISAHLLCQAGTIKVEVEEPATGEKLLLAALASCDKVEEERLVVACRLAALNQLGIVWCQRDDMAKAREHLEKALTTYFTLGEGQVALLEDLVTPSACLVEGEGRARVELLVTHTYYYLAQVHGQLGNPGKSAEFCHETLARQLRAAAYQPLDWATNAAVLSQFYLHRGNFRAARYHLASARAVFDRNFDPEGRKVQRDTEEGEKGEREERGEKEEEEREAVGKCRGTMDRLAAKYGLALLESSWKQVEEKMEEVGEVGEEAVECPEFAGLELGAQLEEVTAARVRDWEEARLVFLWSQKKIVGAQAHFTLADHCSDHVELAREHSHLYRLLANWEADPDRQAKMLRRRADLLEAVLEELSLAHYLLTIRQLRFELGEIYSDLMDVKRARLAREPGNPAVGRKVNLLVQQAVAQFTAFQDTMRVEGRLPEEYNEDTVRPALLCHFHLGRLATKLVVPPGGEEELRGLAAALTAYREIVDYCDKHELAAKAMEEEVEVCREMVRLLPVKMERMRREMRSQ